MTLVPMASVLLHAVTTLVTSNLMGKVVMVHEFDLLSMVFEICSS